MGVFTLQNRQIQNANRIALVQVSGCLFSPSRNLCLADEMISWAGNKMSYPFRRNLGPWIVPSKFHRDVNQRHATRHNACDKRGV